MDYCHDIITNLNHLIQTYASSAEMMPLDADGKPLPANQGHLLMLLLKKGAQSNADLAEAMQLSRPAITKTIKALIKQDAVTESVSPEDKRSRFYQLTTTGRELAEQHKATHEKMQARIHTVMQDYPLDQQAAIAQFLEQINRKEPS